MDGKHCKFKSKRLKWKARAHSSFATFWVVADPDFVNEVINYTVHIGTEDIEFKA